jgi:hypothetical protein
MRLHRTAQLAAKNHAASLASLAKPPKKKGYNSYRENQLQSGFWRFCSAPVKRLPLGRFAFSKLCVDKRCLENKNYSIELDYLTKM